MKELSMAGFDSVMDNLEEFINKQGFTLGSEAECLQKLLNSMNYCYIHGVVTGSQLQEMHKKFTKKFQEALQEL